MNTNYVDCVGDEAELDEAFEDGELEDRRKHSMAAAKQAFYDVASSNIDEEASWIDANANGIFELDHNYYRSVQAHANDNQPSPSLHPLLHTHQKHMLPSSAHQRYVHHHSQSQLMGRDGGASSGSEGHAVREPMDWPAAEDDGALPETVATAALAQHADKEYGESLAPVIVLARRPPFFLPPFL